MIQQALSNTHLKLITLQPDLRALQTSELMNLWPIESVKPGLTHLYVPTGH